MSKYSVLNKRKASVEGYQQSFKVNADPGGYTMNSQQLDELWHYEFYLAHQWLGLPLRTCTSKPSIDWGEPMDNNDFKRLKSRVRTMWSRAAEFFSICHDDNKGFGLKVYDFIPSLSLTDSNCHSFGWLAVCPSLGACPTANRYLRSPIGDNLYLGGPISLSNWATTREATVKLRKSTSSLPDVKYLYFVNTVHPVPSGSKVVWNYGITGAKEFPFFTVATTSWEKSCCSARDSLEACGAPAANAASMTSAAPAAPRKRQHIISSYRFCTLCGVNLDETNTQNIKAHLARKHAFELSRDLCKYEGAIHGTAFLGELHRMLKVLESLKDNGYHPLPACHFFKTRNIAPLNADACEQEKGTSFENFKREAHSTFRDYKVLYLRGTSHPLTYEDLLPVQQDTGYAEVKWVTGTKPAHGLFSVKGKLTNGEIRTLERIIYSSLNDIVASASGNEK